MKKVFLLFMMLYCMTVYAMDALIKPITLQGKTQYELEVGTFPQENNALQLKLKLSAILKKPLRIEHLKDRHLYKVIVGPFTTNDEALLVQEQLQHDAPDKPLKLAETPTKEEPVLSKEGANNKLWNLNNADIRAVIAEVSRATGKNFIIDPRVQGKISIISSSPMTNDELYHVFLSMLQVSGFAAVNGEGVIKIVPNMDAKSSSYDFQKHRGLVSGDEVLVEVIPVHYVPAEQLVPVLRPLIPQWGTISAYGPSNMLVLSGRASNIRLMADIIRQVDTSSAQGIDVVPLHSALAMDVVVTLKELIKTTGNQHQILLAADDRSNAILLSGSRTDRIRLRLLIARLDKSNPNSHHGNTQVVYLSYLRAQDLVPILAGIAQANFSGNVATTIGTVTTPALDSTNPASNLANGSSSGAPSGASSANPSQAATPTMAEGGLANTSAVATQNQSGTKPTVQIIAEPNTNSIILNAPSSVIRVLKSVIRQLDIKPAQLLIEALVAEIDERDVHDLGIEWGTRQQGGAEGVFRQGFAILNSRTSSRDVQAQIYALATRRRANILSTPSVVVLDNRQAKILVGEQVSVASSTYPNNANGTTNATPYLTYERVNVALHLYVRPQITKGRGIHMQIDQGNDTLAPGTEIANNITPVFNISSIVTSVHVESGDTVVLGGLIQNSLGESDSKIPIIGSLPGIGRLFQRDEQIRSKKILMVFIKPTILKTDRDAYKVSSVKYNDFREHELDWIRSQPVDPRNNDIVLPPLDTASLPRPYTKLSREAIIVKKKNHG